jgi:hypothetical protein
VKISRIVKVLNGTASDIRKIAQSNEFQLGYAKGLEFAADFLINQRLEENRRQSARMKKLADS